LSSSSALFTTEFLVKTSSILLLAGALTLAAGTARVARVLMRPPPPVTIVKEVAAPAPVVTYELVARHALVPGDFLDGSSLAWREESAQSTHVGRMSANNEADRKALEATVLGAAVRHEVAADAAITRDLLVHSGEPGFIAAVLAPGMRAISIPTSAVSSNAGLVTAGDWVDVILSLDRNGTSSSGGEDKNPSIGLAAQTILQHVRVLALNNNTTSIAPAAAVDSRQEKTETRNAPARAYYETITLEVAPQEAERLAVAKEVGTLQVALRGAKDELAGEPLAVRQGVTRINDTTAIFAGQGKGAAAVTVKTYHGPQQGAQTFKPAY
jgi:pilus assembly protein CpaB